MLEELNKVSQTLPHTNTILQLIFCHQSVWSIWELTGVADLVSKQDSNWTPSPGDEDFNIQCAREYMIKYIHVVHDCILYHNYNLSLTLFLSVGLAEVVREIIMLKEKVNELIMVSVH